ncbi:MAG: hypothetical protein K5640_01155 [Treponema sp.]|nr:hypothetical protein [Treponema sp.]
MKKVYKIPGYTALLLSSIILFSCASASKYDFSEIDNAIAKNDLDGAFAKVESKSDTIYSKHDYVLESLDKGLLSHYAEKYDVSNEKLSSAEKTIEELSGVSVSQSVTSFLTNDTVKDYEGELYEDIYTNIFMALNYLNLNKFDDAMVEIRRFDNKLKIAIQENQQKIQSAKSAMSQGADQVPSANIKFHNSALARYLSMLMYKADGDIDNAAIDLRMIKDAFALQKDLYDFPMPDFLEEELTVPKNMARLNVLTFTGYAPVKIEEAARLNLGSTYYKLALPKMQKRPATVARIKVNAKSKIDGTLYTADVNKLESIEDIAIDTFQQHYAMIFMKSLTRSISKATTTAALNHASDKTENSSASLVLSIFSIASAIGTEITEQADCRTSRFFPATASIAGLTLEPGLYDIELIYYDDSNHTVGQKTITDYVLKADSLNLLEDICLGKKAASTVQYTAKQAD